MPRILFLFLDGIGLGVADPTNNPFASAKLPGFRSLSGGEPWTDGMRPVRSRERVFVPLDANLGVAGFPQSGTGQATLFTGVNCAELAGKHFGPYPHSATRETLRTRSIFAQLRAAGQDTAFANAYPPIFFEAMRRRDRWPVTTRCCLDAGVRIRDLTDLEAGTALAADLTGAGLRERIALETTIIDEHTAANRLLGLASAHTFTLFEVFHTDKAGHRRDHAAAATLLASLDRFLSALIAKRPQDVLLVLTSDHGNLEDLSTKTHTRNPVPLAVLGPGADALAEATSLKDVVPALMSI